MPKRATSTTTKPNSTDDYPPHDPDADPCRCVDCCEVAWTRQQEADLSEPPARWWQIDKGEMRRSE